MKDPLGLKAFAMQWDRAGQALKAICDAELRSSNPVKDLAIMYPLFDQAIRTIPASPDSGLLEWQTIMRKWNEQLRSR